MYTDCIRVSDIVSAFATGDHATPKLQMLFHCAKCRGLDRVLSGKQSSRSRVQCGQIVCCYRPTAMSTTPMQLTITGE